MSAREEYRVKELNTSGGANRFKFKSFSERISGMRVDVFHKVQAAQLAPETPSYFQDAILRWKELNLTAHYNEFVREVNPFKNSLAQILFHKDKIVQMLIKHLSIEGSLATTPLLDLIATLSRDLRQEFYPFFPDIFVCLQRLLANAGPDAVLIENIFACLSYLFKFLQKQLTADLPKIFELTLPLLSHNRWYIRRFAAETFAFLVRRLDAEDLHAPIENAFAAIDKDATNDDLSQGLSDLFFEVIRGPKPHFFSHTPTILRTVLTATRSGAPDARRAVTKRLYEKARRFTDQAQAAPLWTGALNEATQASELKNLDALAFAFTLLEGLVSFRQGLLVSDAAPLLAALKLALPSTHASVHPPALNLLAAVLTYTKAIQSHSVVCRNLIAAAFAIPDAALVLPWVLSLRDIEHFGALCWDASLAYVSKHAAGSVDAALNFFMELATDPAGRPPLPSVLPNGRIRCPALSAIVAKILQRSANSQNGNVSANPGTAASPKAQTPSKKAKRAGKATEAEEAVLTVGVSQIAEDASAAPSPRLWLALACAALLEADKTSLSALEAVAAALAKRPHTRTNRFLLAAAVSALTAHWRDCGLVAELRAACPEITGHVIATPREPALVAAVAEFLHLLKRREEDEASSKNSKADDTNSKKRVELMERLRTALQENLSSSVMPLREATLRLLMALPHPPEALSLLQLFASIYRVESGIDQAREMAVPITALENGAVAFPAAYLPLVLHFELGLFWIKFAPVWAAAQAPLTAFARAHFALYWGVVFPRLCQPSLIEPPVADVEHTDTTPEAEKFYAEIEAPFDVPASAVTQVLTSLWRNCATVPDQVERHSRQLVPEFFAFLAAHVRDFDDADADAEETAVEAKEPERQRQGDEAEEEEEVAAAEGGKGKRRQQKGRVAKKQAPAAVVSKKRGAGEQEVLNAKGATDRLLTWLSLFAQFRNPRGLHQTERVHATFTRLLRRPNPKVQLAALKCLMTWRHEYLTANRERLERLVDESSYREELTALTADVSAGAVAGKGELLTVVIQLLFPKLLGRVGRTAKSGLNVRRATVLAFFSGLDESHLDVFFGLLFEPFDRVAQNQQLAAAANTAGAAEAALPATHQLSFLGILGAVFKQLGQRVLPRVAKFVELLLRLLEPALNDSALHTVRIECLKRLGKLVSIFPDYDHSTWLPRLFAMLAGPISRLARESPSAPSPLLLLLLELGETPKLASYFKLDLTVLPNILALFGASALGRPVAALMADFVHQLLLHAETDKTVEELIKPHVALLLHNLHSLLVQRGSAKKTSLIAQSRSEISLLSKLSKYATKPESVAELVDLLLPFLAPSSRIDEDSRRNIVSIVGNSLRLLKEPVKLLYPLSRLLADSTDKETRATACAALAQLAAVVPALQKVVPMLSDTNAYLSTRMDEPDHERRLAAFTLIETAAPALNDVQLVPLICNCFFFLPDPELSTRQIASGLMRTLLSATAARMRADEEKGVEKSKYADIAARLVMPRLKTLIAGVEPNSREEALLALAHMVPLFPALYGDMAPLRNEAEPDADFFLNITHIQRHRRTRALQRFAEYCKEGKPTRDHLTRLFVPLFMRLVMDSTEADHLIVDAAVAAVAAACAQLPWRDYNTLLRAALKGAAKKPEQTRPLVKLVLGIIAAFHFDASVEPPAGEDITKTVAIPTLVLPDKPWRRFGPNKASEPEAEAVATDAPMAEAGEAPAAAAAAADAQGAAAEAEESDEDDAEAEAEAEAEEKDSHAALSLKIAREVTQRVIPQLYTLFSGEKTPVASMVSMGEGVAHLIKLLPASVRDAQVRRLTGELLVVLQKREAAARDAARRALAEAAVALGPEVLPFMVREMREVLKRGFQLHVLGHVANALLTALIPTLKPGDLDPAAAMLTDIYIEELTGELAEKKEVAKIAHSMRETKRSKANEALGVVAKFVSLGALNRLLYPLQQAVLAASSQKTLRRLEELLRHVGQGLSANPSIPPPTLLSVVRGVVGGELDDEAREREEEARDQAEEAARAETPAQRAKRMADQAMLLAKSPRELKREAAKATLSENLHVMTEFGLWVLSAMLKNNALDFASEEAQAQLAPFEVILLNALDSRYVKQTHIALKCIERLSHSAVSFLPHMLPRVIKRVFKILSRGTLAEAEAVNQAMRLLASLIRDSKKIHITQDQLKWLCEYCLNNLESLERQAIAFNLLKAILLKKLVVEEIYDLMLRVSQLIVQSQNSQVRLVCSQCLISFMLHYPLAPKRMHQHLTGLVANLAYEYEDGRVSVLETIFAIIDKFPKEVLHQQGEFFFVSLVPPLINDESEKCRKMTAAVIKRLVHALDPNDLPPLLDLTLSWSGSAKPALHLAAAQVVGLFAEAAPALLGKKPEALAPLMTALSTAPVPEEAEEVGNEAAADQWPLLYHLLVAVEKMLTAGVATPVDAYDTLWAALPRLMRHPHAWIRLLVCRLMGRCFALGEAEVRRRLLKEGYWFELIRQHTRLLEDTRNETLGGQLLKNLVFLALFGERHPQVTKKRADANGEDEEEPEAAEGADQAADDSDAEEEEAEGGEEANKTPLKWLVARLSFIAKRGQALQKRLVFTWTAALAARLEAPVLVTYLFRLLVPIYRVNENALAPEDLRTLAKEVMEACKEKVGVNPFWDAYNRVRGAAATVRLRRKQERKVQAAIDPERAQAKRAKKQTKKKELRKRRTAELAMGRGRAKKVRAAPEADEDSM